MNRFIGCCIAILIIIIIFFPCCSKSQKWNGGLIKQYGTYKTNDAKITITVSEEPKGILKYVVKDSNDTILFDSGYDRYAEISLYHEWRLYWDNANNYFWVCSSDRGDFVWIREDGGKYQIKTITEGSRYAKIIPESLLLELSSSQQKWYKNQKE